MATVINTYRSSPVSPVGGQDECSYVVDALDGAGDDTLHDAALNALHGEALLFPDRVQFARVITRPFGTVITDAGSADTVRAWYSDFGPFQGGRETFGLEPWHHALHLRLHTAAGRPGHLYYPGALLSGETSPGVGGRLTLLPWADLQEIVTSNPFLLPWNWAAGGIFTGRGFDAFEQGGELLTGLPRVVGVSILNRVNRIALATDGDSAEKLSILQSTSDSMSQARTFIKSWADLGTDFNDISLQERALDALGAAKAQAVAIKDWDSHYSERTAVGMVRSGPRHPFERSSIPTVCDAIVASADAGIASIEPEEPYTFTDDVQYWTNEQARAFLDSLHPTSYRLAALTLAPILERVARSIY